VVKNVGCILEVAGLNVVWFWQHSIQHVPF